MPLRKRSFIALLAVVLGVVPAGAGPPDEPSVVEMNGSKSVGKPGGELDMLVGRAKDTRLMVVYGYSRLVAYNEALELKPLPEPT